jgi:hypothetical protein
MELSRSERPRAPLDTPPLHEVELSSLGPCHRRASGACDALALGTGKETPMQLQRIPDVAIPDKVADALAYWSRGRLRRDGPPLHDAASGGDLVVHVR